VGSARLKLSDALVTALRDWGVDQIFGVSGANIEHVHDAIHRHGGDTLRSVMAKSEIGAAFMADGHARVHRTLGVCCSTSGGGMMNLAVGVAESYAESVPVLAIVGQPPRPLEGRGAFQDSSGIGRAVDGVALWTAITKETCKLDCAASFWSTLKGAVRSALSGRPGPVALLIPRDVYELEVGSPPADWPLSLRELVGRPAAPHGAARALFERIRASERPAIILGTGVDRCSDPDAVRRFATDAGVPVLTTMASVGTIDDLGPLHLGAIGVAGHPSAHAYVNEDVDLLVAVGTGLDIMTRAPITHGLTRASVAAVNVDLGAISRAVDLDLAVEADAGAVFEQMQAELRTAPFYRGPPSDYVLTRFTPTLEEPNRLHGDDLLQSEAIEQLAEYLPAGGHIVFDAGNCAAASLHALEIPTGTSTTIALGMGGMGYAIAAATGIQLGSSESARTMVLAGDGAFLMTGTEIHTAVELGLPILFVVFNNARHGMCTTRQRLLFDGRTECATYRGVDVGALSRGFGSDGALWVGRATTPVELAACLTAYHGRFGAGPGVLELVLPREETPPFTPFLEDDAPTYAAPIRRPRRRAVSTAA